MRHLIACAVTLLAAGVVTPSAAQQTGKLKTSVNPGRAGVFVDGKYLGPAANFGSGRTYTVAAGEHELKLSEPRYEDVVKKITIDPGKTTKVSETLKALPVPQPPFGKVRTISADKYAAVYVNGKYMGHTDEFSNPYQALLLNPGEYKVKVVPSGGGAEHEEQVKVEADKTVVVRAQ
jgi:hypothetical protein